MRRGTVLLWLACAACAPSAPLSIDDVERYDILYVNWTPRPAEALRLDLVQMFPGDTPPHPPVIRGARLVADERVLQSRKTSLVLPVAVTPGAVVRFTLHGRRINVAAGLVATWLDSEGREIDHSRTATLMNRRALTLDPPTDTLHLEYNDTVAGVWVESGAASIALDHGMVNLSGISRPFHFTIDFAVDGPQGPRRGRRWWLSRGQQVGPTFESA